MQKKVLVQGVFLLYVVRGVNLLSQLALIPLLSRELSTKIFGELFFAQSVVLYFKLLTDYGFDLYGPREVAISKSKIELEEKLSSIQGAKLLLCLLSLCLFSIIFMFLEIKVEMGFYWLGAVLLQSFIPLWFFQGIQKLALISTVQIFSRIFVVLSTYFYVTNDSQASIYPLIELIGFLVVGITSLFIIHYYQFRLVCPSLKNVFKVMKRSTELFISKVTISFYTISGTFFLGVISGPVAVGLFAPSMKIIEVLGSLMMPINQVVYPLISKKASSRMISQKFMAIYLGGTVFVALIIFLALVIFSDYIVFQYLGLKREVAKEIFLSLCIIPSLIIVSNVLGIQFILGHGLTKSFVKVTTTCGLLGIILIPLMTWKYSGVGTALAMAISEALICIMMLRVFILKIYRR